MFFSIFLHKANVHIKPSMQTYLQMFIEWQRGIFSGDTIDDFHNQLQEIKVKYVDFCQSLQQVRQGTLYLSCLHISELKKNGHENKEKWG